MTSSGRAFKNWNVNFVSFAHSIVTSLRQTAKPNKVLGQKVKSTPESETTDTSNDDKKQIAYG